MLLALEPMPHVMHLQLLLRRFRAEEQSMQTVLRDLQEELEYWHRESAHLRLTESADCDSLVARCAELQSECDHLAIELVHVRLAIAGVNEELEEHPQRPHAIESVA